LAARDLSMCVCVCVECFGLCSLSFVFSH
jgi:hypothetical protein